MLRWTGALAVRQKAMSNPRWSMLRMGSVRGSVLGSTLFLVCINNLGHQGSAGNQEFADDTKLGQVIRSPTDSEQLQNCISKMTEWAETWGMLLNVSKCKVMHVGKRNPGHEYTRNSTWLATTEET